MPGASAPARDQARALVDAGADERADTLALPARHQRAEFGGRVERVAGHVPGGEPGGEVEGLVVAGGGHEHPRPGVAGLAAVEEGVGDAHLHCCLQVGVVEDHVGRLAPELEGDPLDRWCRQLGDPSPRCHRAGEGNQIDVGMAGEGLARVGAHPRHQVDGAGGQPGFDDGVEEQVGGQRRDLTRLEHQRAARGQRGGELADDLVQRVVPRGDGANHPGRLPDDDGVADPLRLGLLLRDVGERGQHGDRLVGLDAGGDPHGRADLGGHGLGDRGRPPGQRFVQAAQVLGPFLARGRSPRRERLLRGADGSIDVGSRAGGNRRDHFFGGRVLDLDGGRGLGCDPFARQEDLVPVKIHNIRHQ